MKKLFIIVLMLVYGLSSSGMTISFHYCCGKLDSVSFTGKDNACKMGNHIKKSGCCNDKQITTSLGSGQRSDTQYKNFVKQLIPSPVYSQPASCFVGFIISIDRPIRGTPKPILSIPLFIKNSVFRI